MADRQCPVCGWGGASFAAGPGGRPDARCPECQALERHRFVAVLLHDHRPQLETAAVILDVAPQSRMRRDLRQFGSLYVGLDLEGMLSPTVRGSITALPLASDSVDVVLCMHVLEHVPDDAAAISEMARVLSPTGIGFVQVPRHADRPTDEEPEASAEERLSRFGQADHVRYYGSDFEARLRSNGLNPSLITPSHILAPSEIERLGLLRNEELWICTTSIAAHVGFETRGDLLLSRQRIANEYERLRSHPLVDTALRVSRPIRSLLKRFRR